MRQPNRPKKNEPFNITVSLPGPMAIKLDARAAAMSKQAKKQITRSDVVRKSLGQFLR